MMLNFCWHDRKDQNSSLTALKSSDSDNGNKEIHPLSYNRRKNRGLVVTKNSVCLPPKQMNSFPSFLTKSGTIIYNVCLQ
mmetsp:Transcript_43833/g.66120  ORF Transcript_43833/g.66120 Transcript_43833/m.66120 type:complete len:80 (-) Transcript_43833:225-464(-)